jgi:hypothetical protein
MYCTLLPGRWPPTASIRAFPLTKTRLAVKSNLALGILAFVIQVFVAGS